MTSSLKAIINRYKQFSSHSLTPYELIPGDHIYVWRRAALFVYQHHGIYIGDDKVIHFTTRPQDSSSNVEKKKKSITERFPLSLMFKRVEKKAHVLETNLDFFLYGGKLKRARYDTPFWEMYLKAAGTCYQASLLQRDNIVKNAKEKLLENLDEYHLILNNCEDLVTECTTGKKFSDQRWRKARKSILFILFFFPLYKIFAFHPTISTFLAKYISISILYDNLLHVTIFLLNFIV